MNRIHGVLFSANKEGNRVVFDNIAKSGTERHLPYNLTCGSHTTFFFFLACRSPVEWWLPEMGKCGLESFWSKDVEFQLT